MAITHVPVPLLSISGPDPIGSFAQPVLNARLKSVREHVVLRLVRHHMAAEKALPADVQGGGLVWPVQAGRPLEQPKVVLYMAPSAGIEAEKEVSRRQVVERPSS
jgi:hypothetical protein